LKATARSYSRDLQEGIGAKKRPSHKKKAEYSSDEENAEEDVNYDEMR